MLKALGFNSFKVCPFQAVGFKLTQPAPLHNGRVVLLDHGVYRTVPDNLRHAWCRLWLSLIRSDDTVRR